MMAIDILKAKEDRYQIRLNQPMEYECIIELTLNIPGLPKHGVTWEKIFKESIKVITQYIPAQNILSLNDNAGYYALFYSDIKPCIAKKNCCYIEEMNEWGRLLDIDCYCNQIKISREEIGLQERKCIICGYPHSYCIENHRHDLRELREVAELIAEKHKIQI